MLIRVRLLRAVRIGGAVRVAGAAIDVPAHEARDLLRNRQAVLVHDADLVLLLDAANPVDGRRPALTRAQP